MSIYKRGRVYWYKFVRDGELIRESTRQGNANVARQIEAAHRVRLAKGEAGIRERRHAPTLANFAEKQFLPFVQARFREKPKTLEYYENGTARLLEDQRLAGAKLDEITTQMIAAYAQNRRGSGL